MKLPLTQWSTQQLRKGLLLAMPLFFSQILLRLFPIVDNHYVSYLGSEALLIHNIQANFILLGQFVGVATMISLLVFWKRAECQGKQGSVLKRHLFLTLGFVVLVAIPAGMFAKSIMHAYGISPAYLPLACWYLRIGLVTMIGQALYGSLDGVLTGMNQQHWGMLLSGILLILNILIDAYVIHRMLSFLIIGASTAGLILLGCLVMLALIIPKVDGWAIFGWQQILKVWRAELGLYLLRSIVPFVYAYQISLIEGMKGFWVTYQFALQLAYLVCLPLVASLQITTRNTSEAWSHGRDYPWFAEMFYLGLLPTFVLSAIGIIWPIALTESIFHHVPIGMAVFLPIYFIACCIGQVSNAFTAPIRAMKKNALLVWYMFFSEIVVLLGGTQLLLWSHTATFWTLGLVNVFFSLSGLLLRGYAVIRINGSRSRVRTML
jgi:Na+-driven multidrug efflux pump